MRIVLALVALLLLVAAALLAVGWVFADRVLVPQPYALMPEFEVVAAADGQVTLPAPEPEGPQFARTRARGAYGLLYEDGHGRLGEVLPGSAGTLVTRAFELESGEPPQAGDPARLDIFLFHDDPLRNHGIPFEALTLEGEAGPLNAWWLPNAGAGGAGAGEVGDTAVLMLHGRRRADLTETLRMIPTLVETGLPVLALGYRNHSGSAPSPDGFYHYGLTEYADALVAARFLREQGVTRVVLFGLSMGGAVALEALERWPQPAGAAGGVPEPLALVLDSPLLDARTVFRRGAHDLGLPLPDPAVDALTDLALWLAQWRAGLSWDELDQRATAGEIQLPVLLFAGTADTTIPIELVDDFAARLEAPLQYHRLDGVEHVEGWNHDSDAYEARLREFLQEVLGPREAPAPIPPSAPGEAARARPAAA